MNIAAPHRPTALAVLFLAIFLAFVFFAYKFLPVNVDWSPDGPQSIGVDWKGCIRIAALKVLHGENPYPGLQNAPWLLIPLIPVALLSPELGAAVMFVLTFYGYALACYRLGIKPIGLAAVLLFPPLWQCAINGNIDWLVALGFTLPPQIGLFLVLLKPQLGIGVVIFWAWSAWRSGGWRKVATTFLPVTGAFLLSLVIFGPWPLAVYTQRMVDPYNASYWPLSAVLGAALLWYALKNKNKKLAISASPFLTPYLTVHGYAIALLGLDSIPLAISVAGYWAAFIYKLP